MIAGPSDFLPSVRLLEMKGGAAVALLLMTVRLCHPCRKVETVLICQNVLANFEPGCSTMAILMRNVGEINSTVLQSENLASVTLLTSDGAGITKIADDAFSSFPNLQRVNLDDNLLSQVSPTWFGNPAVLRELRLERNLVEGLNESALTGLTNLTTLSLKKNRIQTIHPDSFRAQGLLTDLDLSENRLTWVPQQIFSSLRSLKFIRLDKNPWSCSCDARDFITSVKGLKRRNQLNDSMGVSCESPPPLKGQPVWNVSVCPPTTSSAKPETAGPLKPSKTETSLQSRPTDPPPAASSPSATPSSSETSVRTKPSNAPSSSTRAHVTSSGIDCCTNLKPNNHSDTKTLTLIAVIAVLSVLLVVSCFMARVQIKKHSNKTVMPASPKEEEDEKTLDEESRSSPGSSQIRYSEADWRKQFCGIRAKSANAVILTSPFCAPQKDEAHLQTETEAPAEGLENPGNEKSATERGAEAGGETLSDIFTTTLSEKQDDVHGSLYENPDCVHASAEVVPYLSIGTVQNKPSPGEESTAGPGESPQRGRVIRRISTWPPSAAQWQARCKMKEEQEADSSAVWTQRVTLKLSDEAEMIVNKMELLTSSDPYDQEDKTQADAGINTVFNTNGPSFNKLEEKTPDRVPPRKMSADIVHKDEPTRGENPAHKSGSKAGAGRDPKRSGTSRQREQSRAVGSKAPSGGASPDDETLLSGNEYVFMNLLHEVAQNNGRWTRERWRQTHVNKQRR